MVRPNGKLLVTGLADPTRIPASCAESAGQQDTLIRPPGYLEEQMCGHICVGSLKVRKNDPVTISII